MKTVRSKPFDLDDIPRHQKRAIKPSKKRFGIEYHYRQMKEWCVLHWYPTEKQRDQALTDMIRHTCAYLKSPGCGPLYRKINR